LPKESALRNRVVIVFLDGVGLAAATTANPFAAAAEGFFHELLGGPLSVEQQTSSDGLLLQPIDACLGIEGLPQSATGQTSLFTGINAAAHLGRHRAAFPNEALKELIDRSALMKQVVEQGGSASFANAYSENYFDLVAQGKRRHSVTTLCVFAARLPFRTTEDLRGGNAVYWDITRHRLETANHPGIVTGYEAGRHLARISGTLDLLVYESFLSDLIGHRQAFDDAVELVSLLDDFLRGVVENLEPGTTLLVTSDHGNLEDLSHGVHTTNPVPLLAVGPAAATFSRARSITDVAGLVMEVLGG
jgi:hypothetical protein